MPNKRKVYQKKKAIRRKFASMKFFFWPLYAISRQFKQCPHNIVSGTDALIFRAGVAFAYPLFFVHIAVQGTALLESNRSGTVRLRQGRGCGSRPLRSFIILILALLFFFAGCQPIQQKEPLTDNEKMRLRQDVLFDFFNAWRLKQDEREFLNRERNRDGTENLSNEKSGPGSSIRQGSLQSYWGLSNQPRGKGAGRSGTCVETQEIKAPENNEKAEEIKKENQVG